MKAIDRVMAAYVKSHKVTDEQAVMVRKELSLFIDRFLDDRLSPAGAAPADSPSRK